MKSEVDRQRLCECPKPSGFGNTLPPVERACKLALAAGSHIVSELGPELERRDKLKAVAVFKRTLIPSRRRGRQRSIRITQAHRDWKAGLHGPFLYTTHIPGFDKMNQYRREVKARRLMDAIRSRERRAVKRPPASPAKSGDTKPA